MGDEQSRLHTASNTMKKRNVKNKTKPMRKAKATPFADVGGILGDAIGSLTGLKLGGAGKWLGSGIGSIFGSGDYQLTGSMPKYNVLSGQTPKFDTTHSTNIISHREYLGDVNGGTAFTNRVYPLNPGSELTFPWLSSIATGYQQYRFHGLIFEFRPLITDFVASGAPGVVVMTTNYNPDDSAYGSRQEAENADFAVSTKPTLGLMHMIECSSEITQFTWYNVRAGEVPSKRAYDWGNFQFISQNNPSQNLGELWVSYCVEFIKPILPITRGVFRDYSTHCYRYDVTSAAPLGTAQISKVGDLAAVFTGTTATFTNCRINSVYHIALFTNSSGTATTDFPLPTFAGCVAEKDFSIGGVTVPNSHVIETTGTNSNASAQMVAVRITDATAVVTWVGGTFPADCYVNIIVTTADL